MECALGRITDRPLSAGWPRGLRDPRAGQPADPARLGGSDLRTLFVTSALDGLDPAQHFREPLAGHLFAIDAGIAGLPEPRFAGNPDHLPPR